MSTPRASFAFWFTALLAGAMVMRGPVTCVGPLADAVVRDYAVSWEAYGSLSALVVAAFGVFSFAAFAVTRRLGLTGAVLASLAVLLAGALLRLLPSWRGLLAGSVGVGAGIALLNVLMPVIAKERFGLKTPAVMGVYTGVIGLSGAVGGLTSVPLYEALGSASGPFGLWAAAAAAAALVWCAALARKDPAALTSSQSAPSMKTMAGLLRSPTAAALVFVMGLQSLLIYTVVAWLPPFLVDQGIDAAQTGVWVFVYLVSGLPASAATPALMRLLGKETRTEWLLVVLYVLGLAGWHMHDTWALLTGSILAGAAQGSMLSVAFLLMAAKSRDFSQMLSMSALAQGSGYLVAGFGPIVFGLLRADFGWLVPWLAVGAVILAWGAAGSAAARSNKLLDA